MNAKQKISSRGGFRKGAGRPKGAVTRLTAQEILNTAENMLGKPLIVSIMEGYIGTIQSGDTRERVAYEKFLLDKTASNVIEAEVTNMTNDLPAKEAAFKEALANLMSKTDKDSVTSTD